MLPYGCSFCVACCRALISTPNLQLPIHQKRGQKRGSEFLYTSRTSHKKSLPRLGPASPPPRSLFVHMILSQEEVEDLPPQRTDAGRALSVLAAYGHHLPKALRMLRGTLVGGWQGDQVGLD